jgi:hypothetical protein
LWRWDLLLAGSVEAAQQHSGHDWATEVRANRSQSHSSAVLADVAQLVERRLPKPKVAGSTPVVRFDKRLQMLDSGASLIVRM